MAVAALAAAVLGSGFGAVKADDTSSSKYNCNDGLDTLWTKEKKAFCCAQGVGCSASGQYNCDDGMSGGEWTLEKKDWCCKHEGLGCTTTSLTFPDCTLPGGGDSSNWTRHIHSWCCNKTAGSPQDRSVEKRSMCCQHDPRGCIAVRTSTTTSSTTMFECTSTGLQSTAWSTPKALWCCRFKGQGCPTTATTTATTVARTTYGSPPMDIMHCQLSCLGAPAVSLPGSTGSGKGASLNDVSLEDCRKACTNSEGCEGIVYSNATQGTPFGSMCFGRKDIHTSMCQQIGRAHV